VLEGGQGFLPTHRISEIELRLIDAVARGYAKRGYDAHRRRHGSSETPPPSISFDKLHNDAYDEVPGGTGLADALVAARAVSLPDQQPVRGFTVSCDARLFARQYPGLEVLTFGPGSLAEAHSDHERVDMREICRSSAFLALLCLLRTGALSSGEGLIERQTSTSTPPPSAER
jgi:acetylornithine deacetylase/succinyl-diaminopimelate desuccinylase-like protein